MHGLLRVGNSRHGSIPLPASRVGAFLAACAGQATGDPKAGGWVDGLWRMCGGNMLSSVRDALASLSTCTDTSPRLGSPSIL